MKILGDENIYDVWPDFGPQYDEQGYTWAVLRNLSGF
jgi:hypothetical protein